MKTFLDKHANALGGMLTGLDRILFRGLLTRLCYVEGFDGFLGGHGVLYKNCSCLSRPRNWSIRRDTGL